MPIRAYYFILTLAEIFLGVYDQKIIGVLSTETEICFFLKKVSNIQKILILNLNL
jgi:hypothetical protein